MLIEGALLPSWVWPVCAGPFVGSLLGVFIRRIPRGQPVALARSACESCLRVLRPAELVPIISYLYQRGRCVGCNARIAPEHLVVELVATVLAGWAAWAGFQGTQLWATCLFGWGLLGLAWIDWQHFRLPDILTLPLLLTGLGATAWLDRPALTEHALAAAFGYGLFRVVATLYRVARGRDGLGEGDAKLIAAIGAWLGLQGISDTLLMGASLGLAFGLTQIALRRASVSAPIPFGPCLAAAAWIARLYLPLS